MRIKFVIGVFDLICSAAACAVPAQVGAPNAQPVGRERPNKALLSRLRLLNPRKWKFLPPRLSRTSQQVSLRTCKSITPQIQR